jgi:hypothetical protein
MLAIMRIWLGIGALVILTAAIALYVLARRPATTAVAVTVAAPHDAPVARPIDAAVDAAGVASHVTVPAIDATVPELEALRASGVAAEVWAQQGSDFLRALDPHCEVACYVAGCGATLTFDSEDAYQRAVDTVAADRTWTGGKKWSTPVRAAGTITVALILYRPD